MGVLPGRQDVRCLAVTVRLTVAGSLAAAMLALVGCSDSGGEGSLQPSDPSEPERQLTGLGAPGTDWESLNLSDEELQESQEKQLREIFDMGEENPPGVELIRIVQQEDWADEQIRCLNSAGFHMVTASQGGVITTGEVGDPAAFNLASFTCAIQYQVDPRLSMRLPRVRAEMQFDHLVNVATPCLEELAKGNNISIPPAPSLQTWLDDYYGSVAPPWDPFTAFDSPHSLDEAYRECPQHSPNLFP